MSRWRGRALGPLLGGVLLEHFWWGSVFLINIPPMLLLVGLGPHLLPKRRHAGPTRLDLLSVALSVMGVLAVVFGLQELAGGAEDGGVRWLYLAVVGAGGTVLVLFVQRQRHHPRRLFDLRLLTDRRIAVSLITLLILGIGAVGTFFLFTQHLQWVEQLSPLQAGIWTFPYIALNILGAMLAPPMTSRWRPATVIAFGLVVVTIGAGALFGLTAVGVPLLWLVVAISVAAFGQGAAMALLSDLIISSVPQTHTGSAAAAQEVSGELGSALGIASGGGVGLTAYRAGLPGLAHAGVSDTVLREAAFTIHDGLRVARDDHPALLDAVQDAAGLGLQAYAGVTTLIAGAAALLVYGSLIRQGRPHLATEAATNSTSAEEKPYVLT